MKTTEKTQKTTKAKKTQKTTEAAPAEETPTPETVQQAAPTRRGSVVPSLYRQRYGKDQTCGDGLAEALAGTDLEQLAEVATENGLDLTRWAGRNPGMIRMNLGNVLRGRVRRGEGATVLGRRF